MAVGNLNMLLWDGAALVAMALLCFSLPPEKVWFDYTALLIVTMNMAGILLVSDDLSRVWMWLLEVGWFFVLVHLGAHAPACAASCLLLCGGFGGRSLAAVGVAASAAILLAGIMRDNHNLRVYSLHCSLQKSV